MKRALQLCSILACLGVSAFFVSTAKADTRFFESDEDIDVCFFPQGPDYSCAGTNTGNNGFKVHLTQETSIQTNTYGEAEISISAVSFYIDHLGRSGTDWTGSVVLYNQNNQSIATSTSRTFGGLGEVKFDFASPYILDEFTEISRATLITQVPGSGTYAAPYWRVNETHPPNQGFPDLFSGQFCYDTDCNTYTYSDLASNRDFAITFWRDDTVLSFIEPLDQGVVNDYPQPVRGTCQNDVELTIFDGLVQASSTTQFGQSVLCSSNLFSTSFIFTENGYWTATASSTGDHATSSFFFLAQSQEQFTATTSEDFLSTITATSTIFDPCPILGSGVDPCSLANQYKSFRPYSYVPTIIGIVADASALARASTTDIFAVPITITSDYFNFNGTVMTKDNLYAIMDADGWAQLRIYMNYVVYFMLLIYFYNMIRTLI